MNTAEQIRKHRIRLSLSEAGLAQELGLSFEAYGDLEQHQDELATCVTLEQASKLSARLGVPLLSLLSECPPSEPMPSPGEVAKLVTAHTTAAGAGIESFEESVGWELRAFLEAPLREAPTLPIMFFQALAEAMHAPSLSLVPQVHAA